MGFFSVVSLLFLFGKTAQIVFKVKDHVSLDEVIPLLAELTLEVELGFLLSIHLVEFDEFVSQFLTKFLIDFGIVASEFGDEELLFSFLR